MDNPDYKSYWPGAADYAFDQALNSYYANAQAQMQQPRDMFAFPQPEDSAFPTPQLTPGSAFEQSPSPFTHPQPANPMPSPGSSTLPSPSLQAMQQCKWSGCYATFSSLSELVEHVNLQHLRTSAQAPQFNSNGAPYMTAPGAHDHHLSVVQQSAADSAFACLWGDCQLYPTAQSIPGSSSGDSLNVLDILTSHLLQDHLGVSIRSPAWQPYAHNHTTQDMFQSHQGLLQQPSPVSSSFSGQRSPDGSPPTPIPEHDCSSTSSHICKWTGCGQSFSSCDELTEHLATAHIGGGRAHYECFWEGCTRNGENGFASKQKISRHMQVCSPRHFHST